MSRSLLNELYDLKEEPKKELDSKADDIEPEEVVKNNIDSANLPLSDNPTYPRVFWGESAKPLMNRYPNSEYIDDNISRTYQGLLSYFG